MGNAQLRERAELIGEIGVDDLEAHVVWEDQAITDFLLNGRDKPKIGKPVVVDVRTKDFIGGKIEGSIKMLPKTIVTDPKVLLGWLFVAPWRATQLWCLRIGVAVYTHASTRWPPSCAS